MPNIEQIESVKEEIELVVTNDLALPLWKDLTLGEKMVELEEIEWAGFTRDQELKVIGRVLSGEAPELWMLDIGLPSSPRSEFDSLAEEIRHDEKAARVRDELGEDAVVSYQDGPPVSAIVSLIHDITKPDRFPDPELSYQGPRGHAELGVAQQSAGDFEHAETGIETAAERSARQIDGDHPQLGGTQAGKLYRVESRVDWSGIDDKEKEALLRNAVDFQEITRTGLNNVYESLASDLTHEVEERPGRRLFDESNYANAIAQADTISFEEQIGKVRDTTRNLITSVMLDAWPRNAAIVDFGIDSQQHYEALYYPIRNEEVSPIVLDAALGHGEKLTEIVRESATNPHKDIEFHTSWDDLLGRDKLGDRGKSGRAQSDYDRKLDEAAESGRYKTKSNDRGHDR